jgi:hypothetical protein
MPYVCAPKLYISPALVSTTVCFSPPEMATT